MIEEVIFTPDWTESEGPDLVLAFKQMARGLLKIVYRIEGGDHVVISAIWL